MPDALELLSAVGSRTDRPFRERRLVRGPGPSFTLATSNLLELVQRCLDEAALAHLGRLLRSSPPQTRKIVDAVLQPLLVTLVATLSRASGESRIAMALEAIGESVLDRLDAMLSESAVDATRSLGARAMSHLFGAAASAPLCARAARYAQIDTEAARALLEVLTVITLAAVQRLVKVRGFGPDAMESPRGGSPSLTGAAEQSPPAATRTRVVRTAAERLRRLGLGRGSLTVAVTLAWSLLLGYWALFSAPAVRYAIDEDRAAAPFLALTHIGMQVEYAGVVDTERSRADVLEILSRVFGEANLTGNLQVDRRLPPPHWLGPLRSVLLASRAPGVALRLNEGRIDIDAGPLIECARLVHRLRGLFGDLFAVGLQDRGPSPSELNALRTESPSLDLLTLLGLWVIHFPPESDELPAEQRPLIRRAARLMDALPEGTVVEVLGHTDDTGDAAVNLTLSRVRAESVREALIDAGAPGSRVRARGYGSERPIAGNERPEGRSLNRRIEFLVRYE